MACNILNSVSEQTILNKKLAGNYSINQTIYSCLPMETQNKSKWLQAQNNLVEQGGCLQSCLDLTKTNNTAQPNCSKPLRARLVRATSLLTLSSIALAMHFEASLEFAPCNASLKSMGTCSASP